MQISTLIGKPILTRTGDKLGYVTAARLSRDLTKLSALCCADADEEEFYLPARTVLAVGDAVIAGNARLKAPTGVACPVGKRAFSYTGEELGVVTDMETGESPSLLIGEGDGIRIPAAQAAIGESIVVYPADVPKPAAPSRSHVRPRRKDPPPMSEQKPAAPPPAEPTAPPPNAFRIDRTNLLGRRVKRSVYDEHGAPIATAGERVTPEMIAAARRKNRLLALTVNTLTNLY